MFTSRHTYLFASDSTNMRIKDHVNIFTLPNMFISDLANLVTSNSTNMFISDLTNMVTSNSTYMFTSDLVNIFISDSANMFTSYLNNIFTSDSGNMFTSCLVTHTLKGLQITKMVSCSLVAQHLAKKNSLL